MGEAKERPILFSGEMVRAILEGRKTQTRRVLAPQPAPHTTLVEWNTAEEAFVPWNWSSGSGSYGGGSRTGSPLRCPYRVPVLWVRERMRVVAFDPRIVDGHQRIAVVYEADETRSGWIPYPGRLAAPKVGKCLAYGGHREASRISLRPIVDHAERLQNISEEDALAEGVECVLSARINGTPYRTSYARLWDRINGKRAPWASNPWVWVVSFTRLDP